VDLRQILSELQQERKRTDAAIFALENVARSGKRLRASAGLSG
jgi:hypothetical protein